MAKRLGLLIFFGMLAALGARAGGADNDASGFVTGNSLQEQLAAPVTVSWANIPLAQALASLGAAQHLSIVLDRRIDSSQPIDLALSQEPLRVGLEKIARHLGLGYCQLGAVAYLGPPAMAKRLRTLAALRLEEIRPLPTNLSRKFLLLKAMHWDELAEPRQLFTALAEEAGVKLEGLEKIPHDLWPAGDLPPLMWIDRMSLLGAQFELTFQVDPSGQKVTLAPAPEKVVLSRTYQAGRDARAVVKRWSQAVRGARVKLEDQKIRVEGLLEDHEQIEERLRGKPTQRTVVTAGKEVYQLSLENAALSQVVEQLAQRLQLDFQWDLPAIEAAGISVDQLISVKVKDASLDELLQAISKGTGLSFRRKDRTVSIRPAKPDAPR